MPEKVPLLTKEELSGELRAFLDELGRRFEELEKQRQQVIEQRQLAGFAQFEIAGIPVGKAVLGGGLALLTSEIIDGLLAGRNVPEALAKAIGAWAVKNWGVRLVGPEAALDAAKFLAFDAARSIIPIDEWVKKLSPFRRPPVTQESPEQPRQQEQRQDTFAPEEMDALFKLAAASGLG